MRRRILALATACFVAAVGCKEKVYEEEIVYVYPDAAAVTDAGADAGAETDAAADAGPDAGADAGPDAGADAGVDAGTPFVIRYTNLPDAGIGVILENPIIVSFTSAVDPASLNPVSIYLTSDGGIVPISVTADGGAVTVLPKRRLAPQTAYNVVVTSLVKNAAASPLAQTYNLPFVGTTYWTRQFGTNEDDRASAIAVGPDGFVYVAGSTQGALEGATNLGGWDAFVTKLDPAGTVVWLRQFGSSQNDYAYGVLADPAGNVFVAGGTNGAFDGIVHNTSTSTSDAFLSMFDADGGRRWSISMSSQNDDYATELARGSGGALYVGGLAGPTVFEGISPPGGGADWFVTRVDLDGGKKWTSIVGSSREGESLAGIQFDHLGRLILLGGQRESIWNSSEDRPPGNSGSDIGLYWILPDAGEPVGGNWIGTQKSDDPVDLVSDEQTYCYALGQTEGDWSNPPSTTQRPWDGVLFRTNLATWARGWTTQFGTATNDYPTGLQRDALGYLYVAGYTQGAPDGGLAQGTYDMFLAKFEPTDGGMLWWKNIGSTQSDISGSTGGLAIDTDGGILYLFGHTLGAFDGYTHMGSSSLYDMVLMKFDLDGGKL